MYYREETIKFYNSTLEKKKKRKKIVKKIGIEWDIINYIYFLVRTQKTNVTI